MKLLVDIGNSCVKWATMESGRLNDSQRFARSKTGIKSSLNTQWKSLEGITHVYVSNVAGEKIASQLSEWTQKQWNVKPEFIHSESKKFGVTNAYDQPELLGVDRWLALIAARQHARTATCVIDCGTAITVDIVTKYGLHQGGMILPGLTLMRNALISNTSDVTEKEEESNFVTLAINTQSAVQAGTLYTVTAALERLIDDLKEQYKNRIRFIITGGDAEQLIPLLPTPIAHYPDVVLKGLAYYARQSDRKHAQKSKDKQDQSESVDATSEDAKSNSSDVVEKPQESKAAQSVEGAQTVEASQDEAIEIKNDHAIAEDA